MGTTGQDPRVLFSNLHIHNPSSLSNRPVESPSTTLICHRKQPPDVAPEILPQDPFFPTGKLPQRRPSPLSSFSAYMTLEIKLGAVLGVGLHGSVYEADVLDARLYEDLGLPDLVVKVSHAEAAEPDEDDSESESVSCPIAHEAFFYEEMECLQGVCIPRCYGFFEASLQNDETVSVLLLERLGAPLPRPEFVDQIPLILEMYSELWPLGIEHTDIKCLNILTTPTGLHRLASLPSPLPGAVYALRIVDFGANAKSNRRPRDLRAGDRSWFSHLKRIAIEFDRDAQMWE